MKLAFRDTFVPICIAALITLLIGFTSLDSFAAGQETKRVFVLNSFNRGYTWTDNMLRGIDDAFVSSGIKVETYVTFMDMKRIPPTSQYFSKLKELIKDGYKGVRFDAVLACDNDALEFLRKYRDELFPNVPVVFSSINDYDERMRDGRRDITGTSENTDYVSTIRVALKLRPATKIIVVVVDNTTTGKAHRSAVEKIRQNFPQNLQFTYISLADMTLDELAQQLSKLKSDSIVLLLQHFVDKNGTAYTVQQSTSMLTKSSSVPTFVLADIRVGLGALGGHVVSGYHHGEAAAQMVIKILNGVDISSIPVLLESPNRYMFDYGAMQRFNISESDLPKGSIIINEPVSLLHEYKPHISAIIVSFIILCLILVFLLVERMRRSKSEWKLRESEEHHRTIINTAMDGVWLVDLQGRLLEVNESYCRMSCYSKQELLVMSISDLEAAEDNNDTSAHIKKVIAQGEDRFESRHRRKDGSIFYVEISVQYRPSESGQLVAFLHDITENKRSEELLRKSEFRFRELAEMLPAVVFETDAQGTLTFVNRQAFDRFGFTQEDLAGGLNALNMLKTDDRDRAMENMLRIMHGEITGSNEYTMQRKDGSSFPALIHSTAIVRDGKPAGLRGFIVDITESKRIERELRETKERYDYTSMIGKVGTWDWNVPTGNLVWNDETFRLLGLVPGAVVPSYELFLDLVQKDDREFLDNSVKASWYEKKPYSLDCRIVQEGGKEIMCYITGKVEFDSNDQPARMLGTIQDITERKRTEERLLYISKAVESSSNAIGISDPKGHHFYQNRALSDLFEYATAEELEAAGGGPAVVKDPRIAKEMFDNIMNGKSWVGELEMVTKSGHVFPAFERADAIKDAAGNMIGLIGIITDISGRKQAEEVLREKERLLSDTQHIAHIGSWIVALDSMESQWSDESYNIFGVTRENFKLTPESFLGLVHDADRPGMGKWIQDCVDGMNPSEMDFRIIWPDGTVRFLCGRGYRHCAPDGTPLNLVGSVQDITERKRLEKERLDMERQLQHSQKLESLGVLAGGIAHDFNNLLMTILGNMELAMDDISSVSPARPYLENAHTASKRAADLTRQMLAYSGKGKFVIENMNLSELVQENIRILRSSIPATINLSIQMNSDIPPIMADAGQIQQVVMNLLTNASEAIGDHAGTITLTTGVKHCDENCLSSSRLHEKPEPGEFVCLEVTDTGSGMDEETQAKIFDPFFTTKFTGRGLGMSAMQGIILGHKGAIFVKSEVGKGTTIRVIFPVSYSVPETRTAIAPTRETPLVANTSSPHSTILIVDDEEDVRQICSTMVSLIGYRTLTAEDGQEAVEVFRKHAEEVACVILDMTMPKMDGYATFQTLRQIRPDINVIISSGYNEQDVTQRFTGLGLAGFIQKPYRRQQLQDELERVLKGE